jgi:prepilin-type N-terminal cleavage/methylation domain-containing protein/prepilin-type processing-associated H-X9-DG protein
MNKMRKSGFTLLEILVVIAIIALLMAILIPVLDKVRDQARTVICRSNLRQWGLAARMYLDDNDQYFPDTHNLLIIRQTNPDNCLRIGEDPNGLLWPYLKNMDILMCPQFEVLKNGYGYEDAVSSYCMNHYLGDYPIEPIINEQEVYNPSRVVLFSEQNLWTIPEYSLVASELSILYILNPYLPEQEWENFATFHNAPSGRLNEGSANMVFIDGHVESLKRQYELVNCFRLVWPKKEIPGAPNSSH